jgi:AbrB family looped-hinge helix DNA binding protein
MNTDDDTDVDTTRITRNGQVFIPKRFREEYGLEPGDEVVWSDSDEGIIVRKANRESARGMLIPDDTSPEKREEVAQELERRLREQRAELEEELLEDAEDA